MSKEITVSLLGFDIVDPDSLRARLKPVSASKRSTIALRTLALSVCAVK